MDRILRQPLASTSLLTRFVAFAHRSVCICHRSILWWLLQHGVHGRPRSDRLWRARRRAGSRPERPLGELAFCPSHSRAHAVRPNSRRICTTPSQPTGLFHCRPPRRTRTDHYLPLPPCRRGTRPLRTASTPTPLIQLHGCLPPARLDRSCPSLPQHRSVRQASPSLLPRHGIRSKIRAIRATISVVLADSPMTLSGHCGMDQSKFRRNN